MIFYDFLQQTRKQYQRVESVLRIVSMGEYIWWIGEVLLSDMCGLVLELYNFDTQLKLH